MGSLGRFEALVENILEGSLVRLLRGHLQPVEIAKRLVRDMESHQTIGIGRTFVPNEYGVFLSSKDFEHLGPIKGTLERELAEYLAGVAQQKHFSFAAKPVVTLEVRAELSPRHFQIESRMIDRPSATPTDAVKEEFRSGHTQKLRLDPVIRASKERARHASLVASTGGLAGSRFPIDKPVLTLGRGLGNDIVIEDQRVSRYHSELRAVGGKVCLADLQSTNGTWVNGRQITECILALGDRVSLGGVEFFFEED